jgi:GntR family transcriptional regulator, rspAB operon transcriptional repressor
MNIVKDSKTHPLTGADKEGEVDRVYRLLKTWLVECKLPPGDFLSEVELAKQCQTSRTPVREACNRLSQDGWLTRIRQKGYLVTPVSVRDLLQLYEYRKLLECFSAEKAAQTASTEQLENLVRMVEIERKPQPEMSEIISGSDSFHLGIAEIAGNKRVYSQLKLTLEYVHRLDTLSSQKDRAWIPHGEILGALQARKPADAHQAMAAHIEYARERMLKLFSG